MSDRRQFNSRLLSYLSIPGLAALSATASLSACAAQDPQALDQLWTKLKGVPVGSAASKQRLVVFFDTRCGYCTKLWHELSPTQDKLLVLWTPVAILSPSSRVQALDLLSSEQPQEWLHAHMNAARGAQSNTPRSSAPDATTIAAAEQALSSNLALMESLPNSRRSVPQSAGIKDKTLHVMRGAVPVDRLQSEFDIKL